MAGTFTHISVIRLLSVAERLEAIPGLDFGIIPCVLEFPQFCELGAVAPDYPLLHRVSSESQQWSDRMHYEKTAEPIHAGLRRILNMPVAKRAPLIAWLLGYLSHYTVDLVVHPVIEAKVGPYIGHEIPHRRLEMYQDAVSFSLLNLGPISEAEMITSGIALCTTHAGSLDRDLAVFWSDILSDVHPEAFLQSRPQIDWWHWCYTGLVNIAEERRKLPYSDWLLSHGLSFPALEEVKDEHLKALPTPLGPVDYRPILDRAISQTAQNWAAFSQALVGDPSKLRAILQDWNMGTGQSDSGAFVYWQENS